MEKKIGQYSFVIGMVIAVVVGLAIPALAELEPWLVSLMIVLGLIVGFLNVATKESQQFLIVGVVLVLLTYAGGAGNTLGTVMYIGAYLSGIFQAIMAFVIPAVIVVGLKTVWKLAKD